MFTIQALRLYEEEQENTINMIGFMTNHYST